MKTIGIFYNKQELGKLAFDEGTERSFFQYNPNFLENENFKYLFPFLLKKSPLTQVFTQFKGDTFKSIPPMFADSLPDIFGNMVFKEWMNVNNKKNITPIEQLAYVGIRGMGALEYKPFKAIEEGFNTDISIKEMAEISKRILDIKSELSTEGLSHESLLNMFRIGSSAGGARPKILVSEDINSGKLIPGDINYSNMYNHYLIKLAVDSPYSAEIIEYSYYKLATSLGIDMKSSKLIDEKHFCTQRFDRENGEKKHILTASGITGWDFKSLENSNYEDLFKLCHALALPHAQIEELFKRMVFNVIFFNIDDHLKNHSFIYDDLTNKWNLAPAYDITYALNPLFQVRNVNRALSINGKRNGITNKDFLQIADQFTIKNAKNVIDNTMDGIKLLKQELTVNNVPLRISNTILSTISDNIKQIKMSNINTLKP